MPLSNKPSKIRKLNAIAYEEFFNEAPDMFLSVETASGIIILCNKTLAEKTGYKIEELIGKHILKIIHSNSHERARKALEIFRSCGEIKDLDLKIKRKDKSIMDISINVSAIRDKKGKILCCRSVWRDITERKKIDDKRYKAIVDDQTELVCRFDPDCTLTFVNKAYCKYFLKNEDDLIGTNFKSFLPEDSQHIIDLHLSSFSPQEPIKEIEHKVNLPSGDMGWQSWTDRAFFDEKGHLCEFQSVGRDVTKLKQSEQCYRQLTELASYGILVHDGKKIVFVNKAGLDLIGAASLGEVKNKPVIDFIHPNYQDLVIKRIKSVIKNFQKSPMDEFAIKKVNGKIVYVEAVAGPILFNGINCVQVLIHDVTVVKAASRKLEMKNAALFELTEQIEVAKNKVRKDVMANVESILMPILERGGSRGLSRRHANLVKYYLEELTASFGRRISSKHFNLTLREVEICNLIKHGQTNKEIAKYLNVGLATIEKHRNHIRRKLGISKRSVSLLDFLNTL